MVVVIVQARMNDSVMKLLLTLKTENAYGAHQHKINILLRQIKLICYIHNSSKATRAVCSLYPLIITMLDRHSCYSWNGSDRKHLETGCSNYTFQHHVPPSLRLGHAVCEVKVFQ